MLVIVAYEQPVTRADIRAIRGVDSDGPLETLMARKLVMEDPRFGGRGRSSFLVATELFLRTSDSLRLRLFRCGGPLYNPVRLYDGYTVDR